MPDSSKKVALITGITGQDGAFLSEFLLKKNYQVHGLRRRTSLSNTGRIDQPLNNGLVLHSGDMTDAGSLISLVQKVQPDEIYNLAAQSHVHVSFDTPEYTANADGLGVLKLLEAIRILGLREKTKFFQASTSELFGKVDHSPQNERTPFYPRSPYAAAKLYAYWMCVNYREAYGIFAANGIMFNHESPLRGEEFVTRKVTLSVARIVQGLQECLYLGNLNATRDWSHAKDMMRGAWMILQQSSPDDFVLASGQSFSVRHFVKESFAIAGVKIEWSGVGEDEVGIDCKTGRILVRIDKRLCRPIEVENLCGDYSKANNILGWKPEININDLIREMVDADINHIRQGIA